MKKFFLLCFLLIISICAFAESSSFPKDEAVINTLMDNWHKAGSNNTDVKVYLDTLADDVTLRGTDISERMNKKQIQEWLKKHTLTEFKPTTRNIYFSHDGKIAWVDEVLSSPQYWTARGMTILEKINGQWKICFSSNTFSVPNAAIPSIQPIIYK